jgi:hypothetical protein
MRLSIAIEVGVWRSGRIGGASRTIGFVRLWNARREGFADGWRGEIGLLSAPWNLYAAMVEASLR